MDEDKYTNKGALIAQIRKLIIIADGSMSAADRHFYYGKIEAYEDVLALLGD